MTMLDLADRSSPIHDLYVSQALSGDFHCLLSNLSSVFIEWFKFIALRQLIDKSQCSRSATTILERKWLAEDAVFDIVLTIV